MSIIHKNSHEMSSISFVPKQQFKIYSFTCGNVFDLDDFK
jgi:hypothetical protein